MATSILELLLKARDDASRVVQKFAGNVKGLFGSFTELKSALSLAEEGLSQVKKVIDETVTKTAEHIRSNYELSLTMGTTVEEASRLAEVADDNKISMEQLGTAMALARKNGFEPSIKNLAQLADELKGMNSNTEKAKLLNETFGRGWKTLLPLLEQGGDAIRNQAAAIDENLIVTDEMVRQEEAYRLAVDQVTDALDAQKYKLGNEIIPLLTQVLTPATTVVIDGQAFLVKTIGDTTQAWIREGNVLREATVEYNNAKAAIEGVDKAAKMEIATGPIEELGGAAEDAAGKLGLVTANLSEISQQTLASEAISALNQAYQTGKIDESEYRTLLAEIGTKLSGLPADQVIASMALFDLKQDLDDGTLSTQGFIDELINLDGWLRGLPNKIDIDINLRYHTIGKPPSNVPDVKVPEGAEAEGGPVKGGSAYIVGEEGPEIFVPNKGGQIIPNDKAFGGGGKALAGGGLYIGTLIINAPQNSDPEAVANYAVRKILRVFSGSDQLRYAG